MTHTLRLLSLAAVAALSLAACARTAPPAPVEVKSGQYYGRATSLASVSRSGVDEVIVVQRGDTLNTLARKHNVSTQALIDTNHLRAPYGLQVGQRLSLPRTYAPATQQTAPTHVVESAPVAPAPPAVPADKVDSAPLAPISSAPNSSAPVSSAPTAVTPAAAPATVVQVPERAEPKVAEAPIETPAAPPSVARVAAVEPAAVSVPPRTGRGFVWPVRGRVVSDYGPKGGGLHNDGINIAAAQGTPIRAAESGVVVYAGNELRGFGNLILLQHADGWMTTYAHAEEIVVHRGEQVRRGQVIGRVGATGNVTSPQVHFEIRRGSRAVNPREHLASETASVD